MNAILSEAWKWFLLGIPTIPIIKGDKRPAVAWKKYQDQMPTPQDLIKWFSDDRHNIAAVGGWEGLTVLDFDNFDAYLMWNAIYPQIITYTVKTGRGAHVYFYCENQDVTGIPGVIDVKGQGGYFLIPPSIHPKTHKPYEVLADYPIMRIENLSSVAGMCPRREANPQYQSPVQTISPQYIEQESLSLTDRLDIPYKPVSAVEAIKAKVSLLQFFKDPQPSGNGQFMVFCPFHNDGSKHGGHGGQSMVVYPQSNTCWCFMDGCTPKPLDVINFYARRKGIPNNQAIQELAAWLR